MGANACTGRTKKEGDDEAGLPPRRMDHGRKVYLNIYDLLLMNYTTSKVGVGIYHTGVHIGDHEYSYAAHNEDGKTGLRQTVPRDSSCVEDAIFKESVVIGWTYLNDEEIQRKYREMEMQYVGNRYNPLGMNCNHFTEDFIKMLVLPEDQVIRDEGNSSPIPAYVNRVVRTANKVRPCLPAVLKTDLADQPFNNQVTPPPRRSHEEKDAHLD